MALMFFTQRDIDTMSVDNIPAEFLSYFEGLSDERKAEIIDSRPDLADVLNYGTNENEFDNDMVEDDTNSTTIDITVPDEFAEISQNIYEGKDLESLLVDGLDPVEALSIHENQENCLLHRKPFKKVQIAYRNHGKGIYGLYLYLCKDCNRIYVDASKADVHSRKMTSRNITHKFYNLELTEKYLKSQMDAFELGEEEKIYIPDVWVEENPCCPIHSKPFEKLPYVKRYKDRSVSFEGYYCNQCQKVALRRSKAVELEDECADKGIPVIKYEPLTLKKPNKKPATPKEIKPSYYVNDGKKMDYAFPYTADCYILNKEDTIVVSDSRYCNLEGHETNEVLVLVWVTQKKGGRQSYLCLAGYCSQCQKYYMDEIDYKVLYSAGRPEVIIVNDIDEKTYQITSGEVFELENDHLRELESELDAQINSIKLQPDYVDPYELCRGGYDDALLSDKANSKRKYGPILETISSYIPKPYTYRVDITFAGKTEIYYLGPADIEFDNHTHVISYNSPFGGKLVNYRTINVEKNGKKYDIKLSRRFDIENATLFGYENLRTDEDVIFRNGVTDPFLIRVLNMRKKQHSLIDIIATIQENQNSIVDAPFTKNLVVQGCAGSGKTMVLLHRLSSLKYNHPEYDFDNALILTPNEQFSLHIKGLAEGLQIGNIERVSVEQYYIEILCKYSEDFRPSSNLASEIFVKQIFVDYIYSDEFLEKFESAYNTVMEEQKRLITTLNDLAEAMGEDKPVITPSVDVQLVPSIKRELLRYSNQVANSVQKISAAKQKLSEVVERKQYLTEQIPKSEEFAGKIVQDTLPGVYSKIGHTLSEIQHRIDEQKHYLNSITDEARRINESFILFGKKAKLEALKKKADSVNRKIRKEEDARKDIEAIFDNTMAEKSDAEIITWMQRLSSFVPEIREDIRLCNRAKEELHKYLEEMACIEEKIAEATTSYTLLAEQEYSAEIKQAIAYISAQIEENSLIGTYNKVFDLATRDFISRNKVKSIKGTHRYDIYAQLHFAMKFYGKKLGESNFICVDEGQDLAINEYKLLYSMNSNNVIFNVFGDVNQLLKPGRGIADWAEYEVLFKAERHTLNENYRNTNQITRFCNDSFDMNVLQTGVDGAKVREIPRKELEDELSTMSIGNERIAILVPRCVRKTNYLNKSLISSEVNELIGNTIDNGKIAFMYVDEVKGIEFDKVYVIPNKMTQNEKYIAYTRALSELIIVVDESIPDVTDKDENSEKTPVGKLVELIKQENMEEASAILGDIIEGQTEKQKCVLFTHLFGRVFPNKYTCLIRLIWPNTLKHGFKEVLSSMGPEVRRAIYNKVDMKTIVTEIYEAGEYDKLTYWLDSFSLWGKLDSILPSITQTELLLKLNSFYSLSKYYSEVLSNSSFEEVYSFLYEGIDSLDSRFIIEKCTDLYIQNPEKRSSLMTLFREFPERIVSFNSKTSISCPKLIELCTLATKDDDFQFIKYLIESFTTEQFSLKPDKKYAQNRIAPEMQSLMEQLINSRLTEEQKVYMFLNTKLRKEIQLNRFLEAFSDNSSNHNELVYYLRDYWFVGTIKYVTEDGFVRVALQNVSSTRLGVFDSKTYHITGENGVWVEPRVDNIIYFKIKKFNKELDLFSLDYPCENIAFINKYQ